MHCGHTLDEAERIAQPGGGTLLECVTLHTALVPGMPVPSIVGDIRLAEGIALEGVIGVADERELAPGMRLRAVAQPLDGGALYGCRFVPAGEDQP
jgi:uncharacterized OB-fold protein